MRHHQIALLIGSLRRGSLFDTTDNIGEPSRQFLQNWMDHYVSWVKKHAELSVPGP